VVPTRKALIAVSVVVSLFALAGCESDAVPSSDSTDSQLFDLCEKVTAEVLGDTFSFTGIIHAESSPALDETGTEIAEFGDSSLSDDPAATHCLVFGSEVPERVARVLVRLPDSFFVQVETLD